MTPYGRRRYDKENAQLAIQAGKYSATLRGGWSLVWLLVGVVIGLLVGVLA